MLFVSIYEFGKHSKTGDRTHNSAKHILQLNNNMFDFQTSYLQDFIRLI
jgi:hypothetical protein